MNITHVMTVLPLGLIGLGCQNLADSQGARSNEQGCGDEVELALSEVPQSVMDAALAAVPGFVLEEAVRETEDGATVYCLAGQANGEEYEVEVNANGEVTEIDSGAEDEDGDEEEEDEVDEDDDEDDE